jgi:hypothetical protein
VTVVRDIDSVSRSWAEVEAKVVVGSLLEGVVPLKYAERATVSVEL